MSHISFISHRILENCCIEILIAKARSTPSPYFPHQIKMFLNKDFDVIKKPSDLVYDVKSLLIPPTPPQLLLVEFSPSRAHLKLFKYAGHDS